jgi:hypothetical protein
MRYNTNANQKSVRADWKEHKKQQMKGIEE